MDFHKPHKHSSSLPRTSRVNEKIIEYYTKFGQDRDLEKFMRLYSPNSSKSGSRSKTSSRSKSGSRSKSRITTSTTTTTTSSCGDFSEDEPNCGAIRRLFLLNNPECKSSSETSKSVPNSSQEQMDKSNKIVHIIPIRLEEDENLKTNEQAERNSSDDADSPLKSQRKHAIQTQTPDSIKKTHKRLEWDSLGDVGYIKSMSTSNISILERSLLREFFQEGSTTTSSSHKASVNASEGDLQKKLKKELVLDYKRLKNKTTAEHKIYKKPLASSTLVETKSDNARSKYSDKATTTNTLQLAEKLNQISLQQPTIKQSQAVQVDMSNTSNSPNTCSSTTTNSFEYCCSALSSLEDKAGLSISKQIPSDFVASIHELITRHRRQDNNNDKQSRSHDIKNDSLVNFEFLADSLTKAFREDKENAINTNQFDLGVQLLCSLIDAKSLDNKEKKKLVRDIVKRITQLEPTMPENTKNPGDKETLKKSTHLKNLTNKTSEEPAAENKIGGPHRSNKEIKISQKKGRTASSSSYLSEKLINVEVFPTGSVESKSSSQPTTSKNAAAALAAKTVKQNQSKAPTKEKIEKSANSNSLEKKEQLKSVEVVPKSSLPTVSSSLPTTSKKAAAALAARTAKQKQLEAPTKGKIDKTVQTTNSTSSYKSKHLLNVEVLPPTSSHPTASTHPAAALAKKTNKLIQAEAPAKEPTDRTAQATNSTSSYKSEHLLNVEVFPASSHPTTTSSQPTTSKKAAAALAAKAAKQKQLEPLATNGSSKTQLDEINNELLIVIQSPVEFKTSSENHSQDDQTANTSGTIYTNTTPSSSKEVTTLKAVNNITRTNSSDADATMDEWLNPLTQSEIEYEQKKRELAGKTKKDESNKQSSKVKQPETEREVQLNWIDTEIQRLESLKHLLLEENTGSSKKNIAENDKNAQRNSLDVYKEQGKEEKIYDTVYSDPDQTENTKSSVLSKGGERKIKEIEVIIEESNEDVINFRTKLKRTKERKRETQIYYGKPNKEQEKLMDFAIQPTGKPLFRRMRETVVTNEDQILSITDEHTKGSATQRSKIDTPSGSNGSESVGSFVQQRKREFIEHYKNKKKSHYEALQQQQQQAKEAAQAATTGHYSVPRTAQQIYGIPTHAAQLHPNYYHDQMQPHHIYWQQHMTPPAPTTQPPSSPPPPPPQPQPQPPVPERRLSYSASAGLTSVQSTKTQTHSSSSMFGISSEISIPMGSNETNSTTTTTHQYDDVFVGGGIAKATSESITTTSHKTRSALVPFKPKSIAYVISFDADSVVLASQTSVAQETEMLTLQEYLERSRPKFCQHSKERKAILNRIQAMRQERERELRDIVDNANEQSLDRKLLRLRPPPTKHTRIFPTKEMKAITNKHYARLPEVLEKQQREREERRRRGNRIIRDVFNSRLQKRVRKGKLSLNHSRTVI